MAIAAGTNPTNTPRRVHRVLQAALRRRWKNLAKERIEDVRPTIPRGDKFWELTRSETRELEALIASDALRSLATALRKRDEAARIRLLDSAYWVKGCSSLGRLRYAALVGVGGRKAHDICFLDIKEATAAAAPRAADAVMPRDHAERVVQGAHHLAPNLGERMLAGRFGGKSVVIRELMPQDLKLEIDQLTQHEAVSAARYLAAIVGEAHAKQLDRAARRGWRNALAQRRSKNIDAPSWLWTSVVELMASHEAGYLEHCRRYSLAPVH